MEKIKGYVQSIKYKNDENGYTIAKLETPEKEIITILGFFPILNEEVLYEFQGSYVIHPTFGKQFKVETYERIEDITEPGLIRYLSSEQFTGIGPKTAMKIVELLGVDAIDKILADPNVLSPILKPERRQLLYEQLTLDLMMQKTFIKLFEYGLSYKVSMNLYKIYGSQTVEKIEEDPFRLMYEVDGFGFLKSLDLAIRLGIEKDDIRTIKAAIIYILNQTSFQHGDLYLDKNTLNEKVNKLLNIEIDIDDGLTLLEKEAKIKVENDLYFLTEIYYSEIQLAKSLLSLTNQPKRKLDIDYLELLLNQISIQKNIEYTEKQKEAIIQSIINPLTIITGGPGTGKTTLIDGLLNLYATYYKLNLKDPYISEKIGLMAPTGRASKRMKEILGLEARTIHAQLGFDIDHSFKFDKYNPLPHQLIIIDEASMIDIFLARRLFDAISEKAQVIIVGDEDQLPSVGPGNVLGDMIASNVIPVIRLKEIHRQAKDSHIISLAKSINEQKLTYEDLISSNEVILYQGEQSQIKKVILGQIEGAIKKGYDIYNDIQVLIPQYKGELGIDAMNEAIQKMVNPNVNSSVFMSYGDKKYYKGDKVIQLTNDKERQVMNGDIGYVKNIYLNQYDKLQMEISFDSKLVYYDQADLENINLAYVISIHKSQGSEYKIVFLPIIKSYLHMLKKELIYTAITRAKEYLLILGDMRLLQYASNQLSEKRKTMLKSRLTLDNEKTLFDESIEEINIDDLSPYDFMK